MGQRSGHGTETDPEDELLREPLLRDEVDDLVAAWRGQRPDLDVEPMQVLSRISRLARHLDIARRGAFAEHGLESWEFDVLSALRRQGPPFQLTPVDPVRHGARGDQSGPEQGARRELERRPLPA